MGNLDARRDWGHAKDYVYAQWLMLQQDKPSDYVIASGETYSVRDFTNLAFEVVDIELEWTGSGVDEIAIDKKTGKKLVEVDKNYFRPSEVEILHGDPSLAEKEIGWKRKISFNDLVSEMVNYDLKYDNYGHDT